MWCRVYVILKRSLRVHVHAAEHAGTYERRDFDESQNTVITKRCDAGMVYIERTFHLLLVPVDGVFFTFHSIRSFVTR